MDNIWYNVHQFYRQVSKFLTDRKLVDMEHLFPTEMCVPTNRIHLTSNVDIYESEDNIRISYNGFYIKNDIGKIL